MHTAIQPTAMVVNDDPLQLRLTAAYLAKDGLQVLTCQSVEEALRLLQQSARVDLIVTDLHMPQIDGWRFCRLLRSPEYQAFNQVPILVLSATFSGADAEHMSTDLGANAFLAVPYEPAALRAHVRSLLAGEALQVPRRVLIVEDSPTLGTLLGRVFTQHGYIVDIAMTGVEARQCLQEHHPALVILDYHLPDMTGDALLSECRQQAPPAVAIMMTSNPTPDLALHFMRLGANGYLRKPFDPNYLLDLCAKALRERALLRIEELLEARTHELRASEAQFRLLFDSIPDAVLVHTDNGTILAVNEVGARWLDYPADALPGRSLSQLVPAGALPALTSRPRGSAACLKTTCTTRTGRRMAVEITTQAITFHRQDALLSVLRDVTERERAITALQAAKDYAENLIDSSLDIIVSVDAQRRVIAFNRAAQQAFGYQTDEVLGQPVQMLYADAALSGTIHGQTLEAGSFTGEILNRRKDNSTFASYLSASVLRDADGQVMGVMGISRDITARKQVEAALQASKEAAEAANRSKSEFLANVSHEIRTPMNGILGMTELALNTPLNVEQREYLGLVKISAEALLNVINDLLDFSKIEAGKLTLDPRPFLLRSSLDEIVKTFMIPAVHRGLTLTSRVHQAVPDRLIGDVGRLRQIIVNLLGNALKFTPKGGIELCVEPWLADNPTAGTPDTGETCMLHVSVRDTGIGIPAARRQAIFEPFVQADGSTTRSYGGTGLGLSIAAQLVALMGGHIWLDSTVDRGSTFHFTTRLGKQSPLPADLAPPALTGGQRVLVVTADAPQQKHLYALLTHWDLHPTLVDRAMSAVHLLHQALQEHSPYAVVLLDAFLPGEDSYIVAQWMRQQPALEKTPIVVLTTAPQARMTLPWPSIDIVAWVTKPVAELALLEALTYALRPTAPLTIAPPLIPQQTRPTGRPLHILLAEDNAVNQRLAVRLLEKRGHTVTVAQDGAEALIAATSQSFDLILMDVQMPHMDGLEATQAIRFQEHATGHHVPIIAMTARAMQGDRERCLEAGMDDYLTKPLNPAALFEVVDQLTIAACPSPEQPLLDYHTLWERVDGDAELLQEIVQLFLNDYPERLRELQEALTQQQCSRLAQLAHRFKGSISNISAVQALEAVRQVEQAALAENITDVASALATLETALDRLLPVLKALPMA